MKITKRELHRLLGEAKKKPRADDATQKTRPDGYADLPTFMTHGRQSPTKYSGYGAQLGTGVIDDPAVADPEGDNIDADALRVVRQLQARGAGQKADKKKKLKEGAMSVTRNDIRRLVNEALDEMSMMGGPGGMRRQRPGMCLYVTYGGGVFYFVAPCPRPGASEEEAAEAEDAAVRTGRDVTSELDPEGRGMANAFDLYSWLQDHDEITHVHDFESVGGTVPKQMYMEQVREVGQEEGLFPPDGMVNEGDEPLDETDDLDEMTDDAYNDDLQSRHGRFTSPENVKGTPQHRAAHGPYVSDRRGAPSTPMGPASAEELERIRARLAGSPPQPFNTHYGPNSPDSPYYDLREGVEDEVDCLYILKRGGQHVYIVARPYIDDAAELAETGYDITDMIMAQGPAARDANVYEFLSSNPRCAVVRVRGAYEMAEDYMMSLEDNLGASTGPVYEGAFPEELEGVYGEMPPDDFGDDMGYEDEVDFGDDMGYEDEVDSWMDYETGEDDVPYGAADVALRMGRGYRTDEGEAAPVNEARWAKLAGILKG